ncbi:MAG TPA: hypothetical protein VF503_29410 [Sphingobium sp.]|uniref:hypothetical protein n=1 Tax=Sphingobium sp. TaxID=1912891 RepID=UPI002ED058EB
MGRIEQIGVALARKRSSAVATPGDNRRRQEVANEAIGQQFAQLQNLRRDSRLSSDNTDNTVLFGQLGHHLGFGNAIAEGPFGLGQLMLV